jgi:hypothetical protein
LSTVAILQSNYAPWKGYFDIISAVDTFVVYDSVQYTKNDWRNRNQIKSPKGTRWITVPVHQKSLSQRIDETEIADRQILRKHWSILSQNYSQAAAFKEMREPIEVFFDRESPRLLSELNVDLLHACCELLGITTPIVSSDEFDLSSDRIGRLIEICRQVGADTYLSGPAARQYLDTERFAECGIEVRWANYSGYPEYPQPHPPFSHQVSIIDLFLCTGTDASSYLLHANEDRAV